MLNNQIKTGLLQCIDKFFDTKEAKEEAQEMVLKMSGEEVQRYGEIPEIKESLHEWNVVGEEGYLNTRPILARNKAEAMRMAMEMFGGGENE